MPSNANPFLSPEALFSRLVADYLAPFIARKANVSPSRAVDAILGSRAEYAVMLFTDPFLAALCREGLILEVERQLGIEPEQGDG